MDNEFEKWDLKIGRSLPRPLRSLLLWVYNLLRLRLHGAIYRPDSFVFMLHYCTNLKAIRYESMSLNGIVANKSHSVIVPLFYDYTMRFIGYSSIQTCSFMSERFQSHTINIP